jgi:ribosomal protein L37AE/L43A
MRSHKPRGISGRHKGDEQATVNINGRFVSHYGFMVRRYVMFTLNHRDQRTHRHETNMQTVTSRLTLSMLQCNHVTLAPESAREESEHECSGGGNARPLANGRKG